MEITNLTQNQPPSPPKFRISPLLSFIIIFTAVIIGFWSSRFFPGQSGTGTTLTPLTKLSPGASPDSIKSGESYGNTGHNFKDKAEGVIQKDGINGEGTHHLVRAGGLDQRAALTSSVLDLDLFISRKVEIMGETNTSNKVGWFLDVGAVKVLE